jgi:hypothetical protein
MALSLHESRRRSRRQRRSRVISWLVVIAILGGLGYAAYAAGAHFAEREVARLEHDKAELAKRIAAFDDQLVQLQAEARDAAVREQQWRQRYEREVPAGAGKELTALVQKRLDEGVRPDRLALAITGAVNEPACENKPATKRFIVRTPLHPGGNDTVWFADNTITVTAEGRSSKDGEGRARSLFDPKEPVTVTFALLGGHKVETSGILPLHHSVMTETAEYRFSIIAADTPGLVLVSGDRCKAGK